MAEIWNAEIGGTIHVPEERRPRTQSYVVFTVGSAHEAIAMDPKTTDAKVRAMVKHNRGSWDGSRVSAHSSDEAISIHTEQGEPDVHAA